MNWKVLLNQNKKNMRSLFNTFNIKVKKRGYRELES